MEHTYVEKDADQQNWLVVTDEPVQIPKTGRPSTNLTNTAITKTKVEFRSRVEFSKATNKQR